MMKTLSAAACFGLPGVCIQTGYMITTASFGVGRGHGRAGPTLVVETQQKRGRGKKKDKQSRDKHRVCETDGLHTNTNLQNGGRRGFLLYI